MKKLLFTTLFAFGVLSSYGEAPHSKPFVIPELREWATGNGEFIVRQSVNLVVPKSQHAALSSVCDIFAGDLKSMFGIEAKVSTGKANTGDIIFSIAPLTTTNSIANANSEAYTVEVSSDQITVNANDQVGALWATKTLLQIMEQSPNRAIPCGRVVDWPDYAMRGFMLDVARKYFELSYLQDLVKVMSYYKLNTFQVHLNDNGFREFFDNDWSQTPSAFRLESTTYPGLAAKDGHYKKDDFRQFQIDALQQGVTIIPEIDAPAHTLAFTQYMSEIGSLEYGLDHLDLFNPKSYEFMDGLFKEYLEGDRPVFVNQMVHIGTDEYSNKDQKVVEKFRYFTDHYIKYVESFGKKPVLWGALTHAKGETPVQVDNVLMHCWYNGYADPKTMVAAGYDIVSIPDALVYIVPAAGYYHDYLNINSLYNTWTPAHVGNEVFQERHPKVKGGMFALWNDHCGNGISFQDVHHRVMPALQTLAVKMWDGTNVTVPFEEFNAKRITLSEAPGVNILGRAKGGQRGFVFEAKNPKSHYKPTLNDVGYNYRVEFEVIAQANNRGATLFESPSSKFYLTTPKDGKLGFSRDGYHYSFNYTVPVGQRVRISVEGTNEYTRLFVDGRFVESLDIYTLRNSVTNKNMQMKMVQTLMFPLAQIGNFAGQIENLVVNAL